MKAREGQLREFAEFWLRSLLSLQGRPARAGETIEVSILCVSGGTFATIKARAGEWQTRGTDAENALENLARFLFDRCRILEAEGRWKRELEAWTR